MSPPSSQFSGHASGHASGHLRVNRIDLKTRCIEGGTLSWADGVITAWAGEGRVVADLPYLAPGFIDAHVHIESSLLPPTEFARLAVRHGTVAAVSDPHEIANVLGLAGVRWMLDNAAATPFTFLLGAPSCVPATSFETAGADLDAAAVADLLDTPGIGYLSEVMNVPGVLAGDAALTAKLEAARRRGLPIDGHAPGLCGDAAAAYARAGITTDHECCTLAEARDKVAAGMRILIREGSAARDFAALHPLFSEAPGQVMLCTDDCHPDDLAQGHIDRMVARAVALGHSLFDVLTAACLTPQRHYGLKLGCLQPGDPMQGVLLGDLTDFPVLGTWLAGQPVAAEGRSLLPPTPARPINRFAAPAVDRAALHLTAPGDCDSQGCRVIVVRDGALVTGATTRRLPVVEGALALPPEEDLAWLAVVNRYAPAPPALAVVAGFGLKRGALASSVAHDSHNVVAVGADLDSLAAALNGVIAHRGGLAVAIGEACDVLPLPIAGLMSDDEGLSVAERYGALNGRVREDLGSPLRAPFMTLSFMALLVIPDLKLSDRGLFDGRRFEFVPLFCEA